MLAYLRDPRLVHEGAHSLVYRGHLDDHRPVVVKLTRDEYPSPRSLERLRKEHQLLLRVDCPAVVRPVGLLQDGHRLALLLDDLGGSSVARMLAAGQALPLDRFFRVAMDLTEGLAAMHAAGVLHLDVKPSNVIVHPRSWHAQLIDLSLASVAGEVDTVGPARIAGSLPYLSPEQTGRLDRAPDRRSDLYSLGATLYELVTGQPPFCATSPREFVHHHLASQARPAQELRPDCPPALTDLLAVLLAKDPDERYQSAWAVRADLVRARDRWRTEQPGHFALRTNDVRRQSILADQFYGREAEEAALRAAVERAAGGGRELLLVAGPSGIGKSFLIHQVARTLAAREGQFVEGKFDQYRRNVPYDSLVQAFRSLTHQILAEDPATLAAWRSATQDAVGHNGQVLLDVLPELELLIGPQVRVAPLRPQAALNRFGLTLGSFISVFAQPEHPLVIFLDDLQWADDASLALLAELLTDPQQRGLLVVGAYRDNEVDEEHRLTAVLRSLEEDGSEVSTLQLRPLDPASVCRWLRDSFGGTEPGARRRADVLIAKTGGNPFFLTRFIAELQSEGVLQRGPAGWAWDDDLLDGQAFTENVVELLGRRLRTLPEATQALLRVAACLGARSTLHEIAVATGHALDEVARDLRPAVDAGLLLAIREGQTDLPSPLDEGGSVDGDCVLVFLHDRVQQSAHASIDASHRAELHAAVGRRLLEDWGEERRDDKLFAIVAHLNAARSILDNPLERRRLAELDLRAARLARTSGGYQSAVNLLDVALTLVPDEDPGSLQRSLYLERGVSRAQLGQADEASADFAAALERSSEVLDRVDVRAEWIQGLLYSADYLGVLDQGLAALGELGVHVPESMEAREAEGLALMEETLADLDIDGIQGLERLPPIANLRSERFAQILSAISPSAHMTDGSEHWFLWVAFRGLKLFRERGNTAAACHGYSLVGMTLCATGDVDRGYAFHQLAVNLAERYDDPVQLCRTGVCLGFHQPWRESLEDTTRTARRTWRHSLEAGDWFHAQWASVTLLRSLLHSGRSLPQLRTDAVDCFEFLERRGPEMAALSQPMIDLADHLSGAAGAGTGYASSETDWFERWEPLENEALRVWSQIPGLLALLLDGRDAEVCDLARRIWPRYEVFRRFGDGGELHFLHGLAAARLASEGYDTLAEAEEQLEALREWAVEAPLAYGAKSALLDAAVQGARDRTDAALDGCLEAVQLAASDGNQLVAALANLQAAGVQELRGRASYARLHRMDARQAFAAWGATRLAVAVPRTERERGRRTTNPRQDLQNTWSTTSGHSLDLETVLAAADAIASQLDLEDLLRRTLELAAENAGADSGVLIRSESGGLRVRARWRMEGSEPSFEALDLPVEEADFLCLRAAHYVARTGEAIVVGDVGQDPRFARDPHVLEAGVHSMLGLPLRRGGVTAAVLLLENRLVRRAFTADRIELLTTLSSQMAIALDNAHLVAQLQEARDVALARGDDLQGEVSSRDKALLAAQRLQSTVFEALSEGVCGLSAEGTVVLANQAAHDLLGVRTGELVGRPFAAWCLDHREPCPLCGTAEGQQADTRLRRADGSTLEVECVARPLPDPGAGVARVLSFHDIGARLALETQELRTRKLEALGQFVAGIAHEFNNLLTPLTGHLAWLRSGEEPGSPRSRAMDDIDAATSRATGLIQQLLAFGRRSAVFRAPLDVDVLAAKVVAGLAERAPDRIRVVFRSGGHDLWVRADAQQIQQVLENLCQNALDAHTREGGPGGKIEVSAERLDLSAAEATTLGDGAKAGRWIALHVVDDGPGIDPETQDRLFEPFFTTKGLGEGSGLGLAVVLGIVKQHGGWVSISATPGGGADFGLYLPRVKADALEPTFDTPPPLLPQARRRVLVIDDEAVVRRVVTMTLEREGFEVEVAADGYAGLKAATADGPGFDLILLDLSMPRLDGWETLRALREQGFEGPVLLTSGYNLGAAGADRLRDQAQGFLPKPFRGEQLLALIAEHLSADESGPYPRPTDDEPGDA